MHDVVLDCMVFAQALINPNGPAGECIERGARAEFTIVLSRQVIAEIVELPEKVPGKYLLTDAKVAAFLAGLVPASRMIEQVPHVFDHPIDPDPAFPGQLSDHHSPQNRFLPPNMRRTCYPYGIT